MDQQLQGRLQIFEQEGLASPKIVMFVHDLLLWLERTSQHPCTEETAGAFASHLMLALARVSRGEALGDAWSQDVHDEATALRILIPWAEYIRAQALQILGLVLPAEEIDFLLLHLGSFLLQYDDPRIAQRPQ